VLWLGKGRVSLGENNTFGHFPAPYFFNGYCHVEARYEDAWIEIGDNNYFNNNFSVTAEQGGIRIGSNCLVGCNVSIMNSDFHPISAAKRHGGGYKCKFVEIKDNVFIGDNVIILKGVHIGDNAVIAAGSVVCDDVAANTIVRGNPATLYKEIYE
jgi:maltose O-acetyltransferase